MVPALEEMKNWYGKILRANMVSRTGRNKNEYGNVSYIIYRFPYWKHLNTVTGSRTEKNKKRVREDIDSECGFPYCKKLNTCTDSRTLATAFFIFAKV